MLSMRTVMMTAVVVVAFCMGWLAKTSAQQKAPAPLITYFSHEKVDASFAQALASTGSRDRKSTRLNSSHSQISYAVFCLKKKKKKTIKIIVGEEAAHDIGANTLLS